LIEALAGSATDERIGIELPGLAGRGRGDVEDEAAGVDAAVLVVAGRAGRVVVVAPVAVAALLSGTACP